MSIVGKPSSVEQNLKKWAKVDGPTNQKPENQPTIFSDLAKGTQEGSAANKALKVLDTITKPKILEG